MGAALRTLTHRPDLLRHVRNFGIALIKGEGALEPVHRQMILTHVAAIVGSPYCSTGHARGVAGYGRVDAAEAIKSGDVERAPLSDAERRLLAFAERVTLGETSADDDTALLDAGW